MARIYKKLESLENAIKRKEESLDKAEKESMRQWQNVGFGNGMRYSKSPSCNFSKVDKLKDDLRELYSQLDHLKNNVA